MPALEPIAGVRVVARPAAIDAAVATLTAGPVAGRIALRLAPDDVLVVDAGPGDLRIDDPHAIVEIEHGFVAAWTDLATVAHHVEWPFPAARPTIAQGAVAGVPAKLWLPADGEGRVLIVASVAHADTLSERLGWSR